VQTQEVDLKAAKAKAAQAQQLEKDLQEARKQLTVIAEDDEDLRDKVPITLIGCLCPRNTRIAVSDPHEPEAKRAQKIRSKEPYEARRHVAVSAEDAQDLRGMMLSKECPVSRALTVPVAHM